MWVAEPLGVEVATSQAFQSVQALAVIVTAAVLGLVVVILGVRMGVRWLRFASTVGAPENRNHSWSCNCNECEFDRDIRESEGW